MLRAAHLLRDFTAVSSGASIGLGKEIPVAAGLGGGSSDAAATLLALNRLWGTELTRDDLLPLAAQIGSDVPFFLYGGTGRVFGRGERVQPLPPTDLEWAVILTPRIDLPNKTAAMFSKISPMSYTNGGLTRKLAARLSSKGDTPPQFLFNAFDDVAREALPNLSTYWDAFHDRRRTGNPPLRCWAVPLRARLHQAPRDGDTASPPTPARLGGPSRLHGGRRGWFFPLRRSEIPSFGVIYAPMRRA